MSVVPSQPASRTRRAQARFALIGIVALLGTLTGGAPVAADTGVAVTAGYRDQSYGDPAAPGADDVTAGRNQSKVWFNDGRWWGLVFDRGTTTAKFRIYQFNMANQGWTTTGVAVDDRNRSHGDVLSTGSTLFVASTGGATSADKRLRIYKYSYNAVSHAYAAVAGFPKVFATTDTGTGYPTITRDTTGRVWVTWTQANKVMVAASDDGAVTWTAPFVLPGMGNDATPEDVAAIAPVSGSGVSGVGVLWSNQAATDDSFYYQVHVDGDAVGTWQTREVVFGTASAYDADNHISLKTDSAGHAIAALKTGRDGDPAPNGSDPLIIVVDRTGAPNEAGTWSTHTVTNVTTGGTRPVLVLDDQNNQADVFLTSPTLASQGSQAIYRRVASQSTLDFGSSSIGTAAIKSVSDVANNDATSSKSPATAQTGILVSAANIPTLRYLHACIGGPCPVPPVANFTTDTTSGPAPLTVQFTDTSTNSPTSWSWDFGDGSAAATVQNPSHAYAAPGTYSVTLTATNIAGSDPVTKTDLITVSAPPPAAYFPITPVRAIDTRTGSVHVGSLTTLNANVVQTGQIAGRGDLPTIPSDAFAVTGNLTVTGQTKAGYLAIGPDPADVGATSSLNFPVGDVRANGVTIPLSSATDGNLSFVYKAAAGGKADIVFDVTGYFRKTSAAGNSYHVVTPTRFLDTRGAGLGLTGAFVSNTARTFDVTDRPDVTGADVPSNATAVTGNLTVVGQTGAGYVSLGPDTGSLAATSTLNFPLGDVRANNVTVKLGAGGTLSALYKAGPGRTTHLVFDITGYFTEDGTGARYVAVDPARIMDSRPGGSGVVGPFHSSVAKTWAVGNLGGIDPDAVAVIGNVTVVGQTAAGYVAVTPVASANPPTSTLNFPKGDIRANGMTVKLGASATLSGTYKSGASATTHLVYDVFGYYK
jgi:PKD repeat protein